MQAGVYKQIKYAMHQMASHIRQSSSKENAITGGNFFFKLRGDQEDLVFLYASQIRSERPAVVLNAQLKMAICLNDAPKRSSNFVGRQSEQNLTTTLAGEQQQFMQKPYDDILPASQEKAKIRPFSVYQRRGQSATRQRS